MTNPCDHNWHVAATVASGDEVYEVEECRRCGETRERRIK